MAELLVRTQDKELTGDPYTDRHRSGKGCVIAIVPDGHEWGEEELNAPFWRIVKVPGVEPRLLSQFIAGDVGYNNNENEKTNRVLRRWLFRLDLDHLDELLADPENKDDFEKKPTRALALVLTAKKDRPELRDPFLLGKAFSPVKVIG